jgi:putative DNA primase/helicase
MSDFDAPAVWDAAAPRLFPDQEVRWDRNGFAVVRCVLGCNHKNGDARPSLQLRRAGGFECKAFGVHGSLKDLVVRVLGEAAWPELGRLGAGAGGGKDETPEETWGRLQAEKAWTTRFAIPLELGGRFLRAGRRWRNDLDIETHVAIYDELGRLVAIKSRLPAGKTWQNGNDRSAKYRLSRGSKVAGLTFVVRSPAAHPGATVLVCAGEKDALVAAAHLPADRWAPVSGVAGEGTVPASLVQLCAGRRVVLAYDPDPAGRAGAAKLWRQLEGKAAEVRVALFPDGDGPAGEGKWDVAAVVLDGGVTALREGEPTPGGAKLAAILEAAVAELPAGWAELAGPGGAGPGAPPRREAGEDAHRGKPRIVVRAHVKGMVDDAQGALVAAGVDVFRRGGQLVRVVRSSDAAHIVPLPEPTLLETLSDVACWVAPGKEGDRPVTPPRDVVRALAARGEWAGVRPLEGVVRGPVLRLDGTVLDRPGYDEATGLLFEPLAGVEWPTVPATPTKDQARAALARLTDLVADFPFVAPSDRAGWLALILTLVARPAIAGPTPLFLVRAPTPGSGKTLLVEVAGLIGTEADKLTTQPQVVDDDAEEQKKMLTFGLQGIPLALIDNIDRPLGSAALASALTSRRVGGRLLGSNTHVEVPVPVFAATGNNVVVRADLARRVIPIDLDPGVERPEERTGFKIGNLASYVRTNRAQLRIDALTALRWYCSEGRPQAPCRALGSYTEWTDLVRQALLWLGEADPCAGMDRVRESGDVEVESVRGVLSLWWTLWGDADKTALDVAAGATEELRDLLIGLRAGKGERLVPRELGYTLRRIAGRVMGGYRLERRPGHEKLTRWRVVNLAMPPAPDRKAAAAGEREVREPPRSETPSPGWVVEAEPAEDGWELGRE